MDDADLELVAEAQTAPFEFCLFDYNRQLAAGYSQKTLSDGLIVHMPSYSRASGEGRSRAGEKVVRAARNGAKPVAKTPP